MTRRLPGTYRRFYHDRVDGGPGHAVHRHGRDHHRYSARRPGPSASAASAWSSARTCDMPSAPSIEYFEPPAQGWSISSPCSSTAATTWWRSTPTYPRATRTLRGEHQLRRPGRRLRDPAARLGLHPTQHRLHLSGDDLHLDHLSGRDHRLLLPARLIDHDVRNDFVLMQKVNAMPAELVAKNLMAYPGRPFFEYIVHPRSLVVPPAARDSCDRRGRRQRPRPSRSGTAWRSTAVRRTAPSIPPTRILADSVKAVRINIRVNNGLTGAEQRVQDVSTVVALPNNGLVQLQDCGTTPLLNGNLAVRAQRGRAPPLGDPPVGGVVRRGGRGNRRQSVQPLSSRGGWARPSAAPAHHSRGPTPPYVFVDDGVEVARAVRSTRSERRTVPPWNRPG